MSRRAIAHLPASMANNPYARLLYGALARRGMDVAGGAELHLRWLRENRARVLFLHFHWDEHFYESRAEGAARTVLSWVRIARFAALLAAARALGYRIVWTIHETTPRETASRRRDLAGGRVLGRMSDVLLAHDAATAQRAADELGLDAAAIHIVPHGSYAGVYPPVRSRADVRRELGIADDAFVFLAFGHIRRYKQLELLLAAFDGLDDPDAVLVIAGDFAWRVQETEWEEAIRLTLARAAADDPRIRLRVGFVPEHEVGGLYAASDAAVLARADGWTSGSLVLALTQGRGVVAARRPAYEELIGEDAGWLYAPGDVDSFRAALAAACGDPGDAAARGRGALRRAEALDWDGIAARLQELLLGAPAPVRPAAAVPAAQPFRLGRGVNVSHWLAQAWWRSDEERRRAFTRTDALRLAELGLDHVRIPLDEENLWAADGTRIEPAFELLGEGLGWCREAGLAAVLTLHSTRAHHALDRTPPLFADPALAQALAGLWCDLLAALPGGGAFAIDLLNEPRAPQDELWNEVARTCIDAIRVVEPERTILLAGNHASAPAALAGLDVPDDPNLVLSFHYYEPTLVTHYRAPWAEPFASYDGPVAYPGRPIPDEALAALDPALAASLRGLNHESGRASIEADLAVPLEVARRTGRPLHCGELGAIDTLPDDVRLRWYRDLLGALEDAGISWTAWDLRGAFGLFDGERPTVAHQALAERR